MSPMRAFFSELAVFLWGSDSRAYRRAGGKVLLLALIPLAVAWGWGNPALSEEEMRAMRTVRAAQEHLWEVRMERGLYDDSQEDPDKLGLIGLEWSPVTTTLGDRAAKEAACQPGWAVVFLRWFDSLGLEAGAPVAVAASGSFPGLVLSALTAAEIRGLDVLFLPSLGASTWGANLPELTLIDQVRTLRRAGYLRTVPAAVTLGGGSAENGGGLAPEGKAFLMNSVRREGVPLLQASDLDALIDLKMARIQAHRSRLVIQIGGSMANLGPGIEGAEIPVGLLFPEDAEGAGTGVIGRSLQEQIPVAHLLHIAGLARREGVPFQKAPVLEAPGKTPLRWSLAAVLVWLTVLCGHRRWRKRA